MARSYKKTPIFDHTASNRRAKRRFRRHINKRRRQAERKCDVTSYDKFGRFGGDWPPSDGRWFDADVTEEQMRK